MKASLWTTTAVPKEPEPAELSVSHIHGVRVTLRRRNRNGSYSRMYLVMTPAEARRLARAIYLEKDFRR